MIFRKRKSLLFLILSLVWIYPSISYSLQTKTRVDSPNTDSLETGIVNFKTSADTVYLYIDKNYDELITLTSNKSIELKAGSHYFFVFGKNFPEKEFYHEVKKDGYLSLELPLKKVIYSETTRAAYARLKWNANLIVETDRETSILLNGNPIGNGFAKRNLPTGIYRLQFEHINGKTETRLVTIREPKLSYISHYFLPSERVAEALSFFPGASQLYKDQYLKAGAIFTFTSIAISLGIVNNSKFNSKKREFDQLYAAYESITNEKLALEYGDRLEKLANTIDKYEKRRNLFFIAAGIFYAINIYDAFQKPKSGYRRTNTVNPFKNFRINLFDRNLSLSVTLEF